MPRPLGLPALLACPLQIGQSPSLAVQVLLRLLVVERLHRLVKFAAQCRLILLLLRHSKALLLLSIGMKSLRPS